MNYKSKNSISFFKLMAIAVVLLANPLTINAQDVTTIKATSDDISDNLDLEAVASIFGDSKDLEDFEKRLNDPKTQISNLDLNGDGEVDYLRVMETSTKKDSHSISIQSVLGKDQYQEVAVIDVKKDNAGETQVQVVGNVDMYGPNYYITPVYPVVPIIFTFFWVAAYNPWYSPWYWGYHPPYFRPWHPVPYHRYHSHVSVNINIHNSYHRSNVRINNNVNINNKNNNYFKNNPDKSFNKRNPGVTNRDQLDRGKRPATRDKNYKTTGKPVTRPTTKPGTNPSTRPSTRPTTKPSTKPSTRPSTKPATKPSSRPATKPSTRPATKPSTRPSSRPTTSPSTRPSTRPSSKPQSYNRPSSKPSYSKPSYSRQAPSRSSYRRTRH